MERPRDVRRRLYQSKRLLRFEVDLYGDEMTDHDEIRSPTTRINQHQPPTVPQFTELGHKLVQIPDPRSHIAAAVAVVEAGEMAPRLPEQLRAASHPDDALRPGLDARDKSGDGVGLRGGSGEKNGFLVHTSTYGIRRYTNGSTLQAHVDVVATHAVSAILNVGQDVDSDWPLQIMGHDGQAHSVVMAPGDMVLYESAKAIHARMIPLNGTSYDNVFVHFRPSKGWEKFIDVPNGGVVADHVEL